MSKLSTNKVVRKRVLDRPSATAPENALSKMLESVTSTRSGVDFIRWLMQECGFKDVNGFFNPQTGEFCTHRMIHNEALRGLYLKIRAEVPVAKLAAIEKEERRGSVTDDVKE